VQAPVSCTTPARPTQVYVVGANASYDKPTHAQLMTDLTMMALTCDITRVVSYMLDDARSEFVYKFLTQRQFTPAGSTPGTGGCDQYHALQHAGETNNQFATIGWWMAQKASELAKMAAVSRRRGLDNDNSVIILASGMRLQYKGLDIPWRSSAAAAAPRDTFLPFATPQQIGDLH
jgi:hypothetical protein